MANIPYDLYEILERKLGKEEAKEVAKLLEKSLEKIEEKAKVYLIVRIIFFLP